MKDRNKTPYASLDLSLLQRIKLKPLKEGQQTLSPTGLSLGSIVHAARYKQNPSIGIDRQNTGNWTISAERITCKICRDAINKQQMDRCCIPFMSILAQEIFEEMKAEFLQKNKKQLY